MLDSATAAAAAVDDDEDREDHDEKASGICPTQVNPTDGRWRMLKAGEGKEGKRMTKMSEKRL